MWTCTKVEENEVCKEEQEEPKDHNITFLSPLISDVALSYTHEYEKYWEGY